MPSTLIAIEDLWYDSGGTERRIKIKGSPKDIYGQFSNPDTDTSDSPYYAFIWNSSGRKELWMYPIFATAGIDLWMWFWGTPARLNADTDVSPFPVEWHIAIVEAVINKAKVIDEQITMAEELALWKDLMLTIRRMDTTKSVIEQGTVLSPDNNFPIINEIGLIDGSERGIQWK